MYLTLSTVNLTQQLHQYVQYLQIPTTRMDLFSFSFLVGNGFSFSDGLAASAVGLSNTSLNGRYSLLLVLNSGSGSQSKFSILFWCMVQYQQCVESHFFTCSQIVYTEILHLHSLHYKPVTISLFVKCVFMEGNNIKDVNPEGVTSGSALLFTEFLQFWQFSQSFFTF